MSDLHLIIHLFSEKPVFSEETLETIHLLLKEHLPTWSRELKVTPDEYDEEEGAFVGENSLFEIVQREIIQKTAPAYQGSGDATLLGNDEGIVFFLESNTSTFLPMSNTIYIEIYNVNKIEELSTFDWTRKFVKSLTSAIPIRYGNAHLSEDFERKNMVRDNGEVYAIGARIDNAIPGIYWLNYFGKPYKSFFDKKCINSVPVFEVYEDSQGLLIVLDETPLNWQNSDYKQKEEEIISSLGKDYFFLRSAPERVTIAPTFR